MSDRPHDLLPRLLALAPEDGGLCPGESVIVAFSGGPDSAVLLDLLHRTGNALDPPLRLIAAHFDHGLRDDSADDAVACARFCAERGLSFRTHRAGPLDPSRSGGIEAAARAARYEWLESVRVAEQADSIATGHHFDDHIETLLMWMFRGTGSRGMTGIAARRDHLMRPLRSFRRDQIEAYADWRGLPTQTDTTNQDDRFLRNRIRQRLIPTLREIFDGDPTDRLAGFARRVAIDGQLVEDLAHEALEQCSLELTPTSRRIHRKSWMGLSNPLQLHALRLIVGPWAQLHHDQMWNEEALLRVLGFMESGQPGKRMPLPGGGWLYVHGHEFEFCSIEVQAELQHRVTEQLLPPSDVGVTLVSARSACFDADRVDLPVTLRLLAPGDRIRPHGMAGQKKVSDLLRERDIPSQRRASTMVVEDAGRIIWVVGITTSDETQITNTTQRVLKLALEPISEV